MACFPNRLVQDVGRPLIARHLLDDVDPAERSQCAAAGLTAQQSPLDVLGDLLIEMKPELGVQFALEPASPEESPQSGAQRRNQRDRNILDTSTIDSRTRTVDCQGTMPIYAVGIETFGAVALLFVVALLAGVALVADLVSARRAALVDSLDALRCE